ncbi:MAG: amidohydrolase [Candidatus Tectomicrobia bacterium]|nr:amidohydrolase [Candidatus Tectomicrobia bacterium]
MALLIKNSAIMTLDDQDTIIQGGDLVLEGGRISAIGKNLPLEGYTIDRVIDATDKLVMPGLANSHLHSHDRFDKGRFDNLPLEVWMALYRPPFGGRQWTPREIYLRTMLDAIELLQSGTTLVIDDVNHGPPLDLEHIDPVYQAYQDAGIRAVVTVTTMDRPYYSTMPYLEELLPSPMKDELDRQPRPSAEALLDLARHTAEKWQGRVQCAFSPSAVQRCTDPFLTRLWDLSEEKNLPIFCHVLETKVQAATGHLFYGKTLVEHMRDLRLLTPNTTLIHTIWVTDRDIELMAEGHVSMVHNPLSNLKLGSGIAPIRKFLNAGVNVALGTDNNNANDAANLFEAMKFAALIHKVGHPRYEEWIGANEVLKMATSGGARCALLQNEVGSLEVGKRADMILLDLKKLPFIPLNNPKHQAVFCEHGDSIETVIVDGNVAIEGGRFLTINVDEILAEAREVGERVMRDNERALIRGKELEPYVREAYYRCVSQDVGVNAYTGR